jgi:uncharacterized protein (DUF58 family)
MKRDSKTAVEGLRLAPTTRLIAVVAAVAGPPALLEPAWAGAAALLGVAAAALGLAAIVDAALGLGRAGGVTVAVDGPVRLALGREARLEARVRIERPETGGCRVGLPAPPEVGLQGGEAEVRARDGGTVLSGWAVRPWRRGVYRMAWACVERPSPFGFWSVRWRAGLECEVRVYPDTMGAGRKLAALFLRRPLPGWRSQRQVGRGRDFEKLRDYQPGDGFDEIHWKATAKRGHPVTKVFQVERTQEVYAVVDASRSSGRPGGRVAAGDGTADDTLLERAIDAALVLAVAAERQGDHFGIVTCTDRPRAFVRARGGAAHFQACREAVLHLQPSFASPDFRELCTFLLARLSKRALLVFFTSLDDPALAEAFVEAARLLARRHVVMVAAPLPREARPLFQGEPPGSVDAAYGRLAGHIRWQGLQDLGAMLHRHGVRLALLDRDELAAGAVSHYFALKQRQAI